MSFEMPAILRIGDFAQVKGGKRMPAGTALTSEKTSHPYLRIVDFKDGSIDTSGLQYVPESVFPQISRYVISSDDLYISIVGTVGLVGSVPSALNGANLTENAAKICNIDGTKINRRYLSYYLRSGEGQRAINALTVGSTQPKLALFRIEQIEVPAPSLNVQQGVADILGALDDRITLLRETNATLEAIAQALFKSWFVDFDPVRAKMAGRAPEGMDEATAALFPDALDKTELGVVPKGWRIGSVEELCSTITNGGTPSRSKPSFWEGGSIPWFKTGEFHDGFLLRPSECITEDALSGSSVKLLPENAILMAIYAAPTVGRLGILTEPATFNQACTGMVAKVEVGPWFLFWTLFNGRDWFNSRANGAAQQNISKAIVAAYRVVVPSPPVLDAFNCSVSTLHDAIRLNAERSQTLSELRDTLLPRLISGQIRLPAAVQALLSTQPDRRLPA